MDKALEVVLSEAREKRAQLISALAEGMAKDYAAYQKLCGEIRGYSVIEGYILDLAKHMEHADDD